MKKSQFIGSLVVSVFILTFSIAFPASFQKKASIKISSFQKLIRVCECANTFQDFPYCQDDVPGICKTGETCEFIYKIICNGQFRECYNYYNPVSLNFSSCEDKEFEYYDNGQTQILGKTFPIFVAIMSWIAISMIVAIIILFIVYQRSNKVQNENYVEFNNINIPEVIVRKDSPKEDSPDGPDV